MIQYIPGKDYAHMSIILGVLYFDGLLQDCSISIANALEILQCCTMDMSHRFIIAILFSYRYALWKLNCH